MQEGNFLRLDLNEFLPWRRSDFGFFLPTVPAFWPFDTHVSSFLLNCHARRPTHLAKDFSHKSIGKNNERWE